MKIGDIVKVVECSDSAWPIGHVGTVVAFKDTSAYKILVEFPPDVTKGRGHDGGMGDGSKCRWWFHSEKYLSIEASPRSNELDKIMASKIDWLSLNKEFST
jgi:hypothetical protein